MSARTRLKDIADHLQVSTALVSGVLNDRPNVWASEETKSRILKAAHDLNYKPSRAAQNLIRGTSKTVALVYRRLPDIKFRFAYSGLMDVLFADVQAQGYDLVVANFATQQEVLEHLEQLAADRSCDAVVLWGREADTEDQALLLERLGIPFVVKGRHEQNHPHWNQVDYGHESMMRLAVQHLTSLGHERLAYIGFPHDEGFVRSLQKGFREAHQEFLGREVDSEAMKACEDDLKSSLEVVSSWANLPESQRPTGFVIGAGNAAWQAIELWLARQGQKLTNEPGGFGAAGIASIDFALLFGEAMAFQGIEVDYLARMAGVGLLNAVLEGEEHQTVQRYCPDLKPAPSLGISDLLHLHGGQS